MKRFSLSSLSILLLASVCTADAATTNLVRIRSNPLVFDPTNLVIRAGDRVVWTNASSELHDTTGPTNLWASNVSPNDTFGFTFSNLGYYPYQCVRHQIQRQTGTVSVVSISLANASRTPTNAQFEIRGGRTGLRAVVEAGTNVAGATAIRTNPFPANGTISFTDTNPPPSRRFYRARVIP